MTTKGSTGDERDCPGVVGYNEEGQIRCNLCEKNFESMKSLYLHLKGTDHDESDWKRFFETHKKGSSSGETVGSTLKELKWGRKKRRSFPSQLQAYCGVPPNVRAPDIVELPEAVARVSRPDQLRLDSCGVPDVRDGLRTRAQDDVDSPRSGKRACRPGFQSDHDHGGVVDMRDYFRFDPDYEVLEAAMTLMLISMSEPKRVEHEEVFEGCHSNGRGAVILFGGKLNDVPPTTAEDEGGSNPAQP